MTKKLVSARRGKLPHYYTNAELIECDNVHFDNENSVRNIFISFIKEAAVVKSINKAPETTLGIKTTWNSTILITE